MKDAHGHCSCASFCLPKTICRADGYLMILLSEIPRSEATKPANCLLVPEGAVCAGWLQLDAAEVEYRKEEVILFLNGFWLISSLLRNAASLLTEVDVHSHIYGGRSSLRFSELSARQEICPFEEVKLTA